MRGLRTLKPPLPLLSVCSAQRVNIRSEVWKRTNIKHYTYNFFIFSKFPWCRTWRLEPGWVKVLLKFGCTIYTNRCQSSSNKQNDDLQIEKEKNKKLRCVPPWNSVDTTPETTTSFNFVGYPYKVFLKVVSATFLQVCFLRLKESTYETRKNVFLFHLKSSFRSWDNQILTFQISNVMTSSNAQAWNT